VRVSGAGAADAQDQRGFVCALAVLDGWLYATGRVSQGTLAWITDAVPTVVVMGRVVQLRAGMRLARE